MAPQKTSIDYAKYSSEELLRFVSQRRLSHDFKDRIINFVQDADQAMKFRFMELPAEIRIMIYERLFEVKRDRDCHTRSIKPDLAILSTCKQIHKEAVEVANRKASFPLRLVGTGEYRKSVFYANGDWLSVSWEAYLADWDETIAHLTAMTLEIYIEESYAPGRGDKALNESLQRVFDFVTNQSKLRHLRIHLSSRFGLDHMDNNALLDVLSALPALSSKVEQVVFDITNFPEMTESRMLATAKAFEALQSMKPELREVLRASKQLQPYSFWTDGTMTQFNALFHPKERNGLQVFANEAQLKVAMRELNEMFKETWESDTDGKFKAEWECMKKALAD